MKYNCPVCNKAGLSDYTVQQIICPQCNSDLKPYLLLRSISIPKTHRLNFVTISALAIVACVSAFLYVNSINENRKLITDNSKTVSLLLDSIVNLNANITPNQVKQTRNNIPVKEVIIHYGVRKGDYISKIARFFYNDWRMYKKIETDNNLQRPYILKIGQSIIIKLKQE